MASTNKQASTTSTATTNNDNRIGVGDSGILAGDGAQVGNDNRDFTDNSQLNLTTSTSGSNNDNRTFDDHSSLVITSTQTTDTKNVDMRDFSDRSTFQSTDNRVTNITSSDPEVAKAAAAAAGRAADASAAATQAVSQTSREIASLALDASGRLAGNAVDLLEASYAYGDSVGARAAGTQKDALTAISGAFDTAVNLITKSAKEDREFAGAFVNQVFDTTKSADQQNTEKIVKAATVVAVGAMVAWVLSKIFGRKAKAS